MGMVCSTTEVREAGLYFLFDLWQDAFNDRKAQVWLITLLKAEFHLGVRVWSHNDANAGT